MKYSKKYFAKGQDTKRGFSKSFSSNRVFFSKNTSILLMDVQLSNFSSKIDRLFSSELLIKTNCID